MSLHVQQANFLPNLISPNPKSRKIARATLFSLSILAFAGLMQSQSVFAAPATASVILPDSGPLTKQAVSRLLITDAARLGNRIVAVADRGYIIFSEDNGDTWSRAKSPPAALLTSVFFIDAKIGWAVGHDLTVLQTSDGGDNWVKQHAKSEENKPFLDVYFNDANKIGRAHV